MKKFYTMVAAALAVGISANAQELAPTKVEISNPSFEEGAWKGGKNNILPSQLEETGWTVVGVAGANDAGDATGFYANEWRNKSWTDGDTGLRSAANVDIEGGEYLMQELQSQKPGTYVLQFDGEITRNSWKGGEWQEGQKGYAFIVDDYGYPNDTEDTGEGGSTYVYVGDQSKGDTWKIIYRYYVVHTTHPETFENEETGIKFGFGYPTSSTPITKAQISCDNFVLYFFDTQDTEAVKKYVDETLIGGMKSVDEKGETVYNVVNPTGNAPQTLAGLVGNTPATLGVSDVTVAPATVEGNNKYYNLQGIEVADPTQPGLYIHNGKKILVK